MTLVLDGVVVRRGAFALGPVTARFEPGVWRLAGPNGAGKTTLLRAIAGDLAPVAGRVTLDGRDVHRDDAVRRRLGFTPVEPELPDFLSVEEGWRMLAALRAGDAGPNVARMAALGLSGGTRLGACSAGMRRKAEILGALAGEPDVLLLDEPFASIDVAAIATIAGWIEGWRRERVVLLTHHGEMPLEVDGEVTLSAATPSPPPRPAAPGRATGAP